MLCDLGDECVLGMTHEESEVCGVTWERCVSCKEEKVCDGDCVV